MMVRSNTLSPLWQKSFFTFFGEGAADLPSHTPHQLMPWVEIFKVITKTQSGCVFLEHSVVSAVNLRVATLRGNCWWRSRFPASFRTPDVFPSTRCTWVSRSRSRSRPAKTPRKPRVALDPAPTQLQGTTRTTACSRAQVTSQRISVKLHLRVERTDGRTDRESCICQGRPS